MKKGLWIFLATCFHGLRVCRCECTWSLVLYEEAEILGILRCFVQDLNTYRIIFIQHMSHVGNKLSRKLWCFVQDLNIYRIIFLNICHTLVPEALQVALWPLPRFSGSEKKNNQIRWNIIKWKQQSKLVKQYNSQKKRNTFSCWTCTIALLYFEMKSSLSYHQKHLH